MTTTTHLQFAAVFAIVSAGCFWVAPASAGDNTVPLPNDLVALKSGEITITGTLTEGAECTAIRADDGAVFSLVIADRAGLHTGDHVRVSGRVAQASVCLDGPTVIVDHMEATAARDLIVK